MAKSSYEYVRNFENFDGCLLHAWIVVRLDGQSFHKFTEQHGFVKPNDRSGLSLSVQAAKHVMNRMNDITFSYGQSDEFSFVFKRSTTLFNRRASKLSSVVVSLFASSYVFEWPNYFPNTKLKYPPAFDSRIVIYPTNSTLRDYISWRQVDCHINNLYNTCFWKLILESGLSANDAKERLKGTVAADKNELLFSQFNCNYNNEPELFRKGTILYRDSTSKLIESNTDVIRDKFWLENPNILEPD